MDNLADMLCTAAARLVKQCPADEVGHKVTEGFGRL